MVSYILDMTKATPMITIATFNSGKASEYRTMLKDVNARIRTLDEFSSISEVPETAPSFAGNAALKACGYAVATGTSTLADDSGLEVAALGGRPGVLSARYGGDELSFAEKMQLILAELASAHSTDRRARFVCEIAIADPTGEILFSARGLCNGTIAAEPRGTGGFGYDPIFIPDGYNATFGELAEAVKHQISHRARAFAQIIPFLRDYTAV